MEGKKKLSSEQIKEIKALQTKKLKNINNQEIIRK